MKHLYTFDTTGLTFTQYITDQFSQDIQWHSEFVLYFILKGELHAYFGGKTHSISENEILLFKPYELYQLTAASDSCILVLSIESEFVMQMCPDISKKNLVEHHISSQGHSMLYHKLCLNIAQIVMTTLQKKSNRRLKCQLSISNLLLTILEDMTIANVSNYDEGTYKQKRIQGILEYIQNNYASNISLAEISGYFGIQPPYFSSFFKKNFGITFIDFLNSYRIMKSLPDLANTKQSILDIALNHGFNSSKTYSTLFKKSLRMSPSEYRKNKLSEVTTPPAESLSEYFSFFQNYLESSMTTQDHVTYTHQTLALNPNTCSPTPHPPLKIVTVGRTTYCLRTDVQMQIRQAREELNINYFRIRDVFSDNLFIYYEDETGTPVCNWHALDIVFDFLRSIDAKPFIEIGFMPDALGSKKQYAGWYYHPNVSFPKSIKKWKNLIRDFTMHLVQRYGVEEIKTWYFDFWTDADLNIDPAYWQGTQEEFFILYHATYTSIKEICPNINFGSPTFSLPSGLQWYDDFFAYCVKNHIDPDFISIHLYGTEEDTDTEGAKFFEYTMSPTRFKILPKNHTLENNIQMFTDCIQKSPFSAKKIIAANCGITFFPYDPYRDSCFLAPYVIYAYSCMLPYFYGTGFHTLSDLSEDTLGGNEPFHGGPGLMSIHGLKKASYNAYLLLRLLGSNILKTGTNYIFSSSDKGYQILLFNMADIENLYAYSDIALTASPNLSPEPERPQDLLIHLFLELDTGSYTVKKHLVNSSNGSAYDIWLHMGAPKTLNVDTSKYINSRSTPEITLTTMDVLSHLTLDVMIPLHTVILLEIEKVPS